MIRMFDPIYESNSANFEHDISDNEEDERFAKNLEDQRLFLQILWIMSHNRDTIIIFKLSFVKEDSDKKIGQVVNIISG